MRRCRTCVIPDTRPDTHFDETGQCSACTSYQQRPMIDWEARKQELVALLDRHDGRCIVPSSGGKDSHYQVLTLLEMGADVTVVTATTCMLTDIGRRNLDNLAQYARTIEITPSRRVRRILNRLGLTLVGDISWPEHVSIFTTPFKAACDLRIPLIFYGENPQNQYGGPPTSEEARRLTMRWRSEFGGFLGLRPTDLVGKEGITLRDMQDYMPPSEGRLEHCGVEAHFLGQYIPWDSHRNAKIAADAGMIQVLPSTANWWIHENLDGALIGIHDYMMWLKYGYGRGAAQISVDIRSGLVSRQEALIWVKAHDGEFPWVYMGVSIDAVLDRIGMTRKELYAALDRFTNWELFRRVEDDATAAPTLIG